MVVRIIYALGVCVCVLVRAWLLICETKFYYSYYYCMVSHTHNLSIYTLYAIAHTLDAQMCWCAFGTLHAIQKLFLYTENERQPCT